MESAHFKVVTPNAEGAYQVIVYQSIVWEACKLLTHGKH